MSTLEILIRIVLAILLGGFIGYEREMRNRPAGFITHTLVCVGACVVSLIQIQMVQDTMALIEVNPVLAPALKADIGRVVAQVVTGVGFLGAGTIIFDKGSVKGLTTATTIWVVACIGLAIGLGYYSIALVAGLSIIFIVVVLKRFEVKVRNHKFQVVIELRYLSEDQDFIERTVKIIKKNNVQVRDIRFKNSDSNHEKICRLQLYFGLVRNREKVIELLLADPSLVTLTRLS